MSFVLPTTVDSIATTIHICISQSLRSYSYLFILLIFIARIIYFFVARYASSCMMNQFSYVISFIYIYYFYSKFYSQHKTYIFLRKNLFC